VLLVVDKVDVAARASTHGGHAMDTQTTLHAQLSRQKLHSFRHSPTIQMSKMEANGMNGADAMLLNL
jgi:hypothetical protein